LETKSLIYQKIEAFIKKGFVSKQVKWFFNYKYWIKVNPSDNLALTDFKFINPEGKNIDLDN
jgi:ribonuclease G